MSKLYLVLGNIGSGKSSVTVNLLRADCLHDIEYVGEDIYKRMFYHKGELKPAYRLAKKLVAYKINRLIDGKKSFITEFVPSATHKFDFVKKAKMEGYEIVIFYLGTNCVATNVKRVANRVSQGADFVSGEKVAARDNVCIAYFDLICDLANTLVLIDNSDNPRVFGYKNEDIFTFYGCDVPQWFKNTATNLEKSYRIIYRDNA